MTNKQSGYGSKEKNDKRLLPRLKAQAIRKDTEGCITVIFPTLNKMNTLKETKRCILDESYGVRCKVMKSVKVTSKEYKKLTASFLQDNPLWENIGGVSIDTRVTEKLFNRLRAEKGIEPVENWDLYNYNYEDCRMLFKAEYGYINVVEVVSEGKESFYVNTEGFNYARYVGIAKYDERINEDLHQAIDNNDMATVFRTKFYTAS